MTWFAIPARARHAALRLVCLPYAGAGAAAYPELGPLAGGEVAPVVARLPGRDVRDREPPCTDFRVLAGEIATAAAALPPPVALFGHSMGALLAFEVTRELERRDLAPVALLVSGSRPPSVLAGDPGKTPLDPAGFFDWMRTLGSVPPAVLADNELKRELLSNIEVDVTVRRSYVPDGGAQVSVPIAAFGGTADPVTPVSDLRLWGAHTRSRLLVREFGGGHFYFRERPGEFRAELRSALSWAFPGEPAGAL